MARQKPTSIPAVPKQPSAEHYQFASALKQNAERHERVLDELAGDLDKALQISSGELPTQILNAGQAWQPSPKNGFLQKVMNKGAHTLKPPTENSRGLRLGSFVLIRAVIEDELEQAFSGKKSAQAAMDEAVQRGNELLRQFERTNP